ncbi:MAG TPA: hypothetical protein VJH90_03665 [archaeon]|nr:hypothetical protein [archaeon]
MFSAFLDSSKAKVFRDIVDIASQIVDEGTITIGKEDLKINAIDRAMVAAMTIRMPKSFFGNYDASEEKSIGISLQNLLSVLKRCRNEDKVRIALKDSKMNIDIEGEFKRSFSIPLLDLPQEDLSRINQLTYSSSLEINPAAFENGIADAEVISDSVVVDLRSDGFKISAEGNNSRTELDLAAGSPLLRIDGATPAKSRYPLDYLKRAAKAAKISQKLRLSFGPDFPLKMEFLGDTDISIIVAPRVSEE